MAQTIKTNLQVVLIKGEVKTNKTFTNVVTDLDPSKAKAFGQIIAKLSPDATLVEVKALNTVVYSS